MTLATRFGTPRRIRTSNRLFNGELLYRCARGVNGIGVVLLPPEADAEPSASQSSRPDSNRRRAVYETAALPTEPQEQKSLPARRQRTVLNRRRPTASTWRSTAELRWHGMGWIGHPRWTRPDSNRLPPRCKRDALPNALRALGGEEGIRTPDRCRAKAVLSR